MNSEFVLIVAASGRMLAQQARQAGYRPLVIDLYSDLDTRSHAEALIPVTSLAPSEVRAAVARLQARYRFNGVVYGSGIEAHPNTLQWLESEFRLFGNTSETVRQLHSKRFFFDVLARLKLDHPRVSFADRIDCPHGGLLKPETGCGGIGIRRYRSRSPIPPSHYWQEFVDGTQGSVLFLADGDEARAIGFNTQWTERLDDDHEFAFSGISNRNPLSDVQTDIVSDWVRVLTKAFSLKGLNTLDFIATPQRVVVLEINPRPSASMQLYEQNSFSRHLMACRGKFQPDAPRPRASIPCVYQVLYADRCVELAKKPVWPEICADLPANGSIIRKGQPICSMIARDHCVRDIQRQLHEARQVITQSLVTGVFHHGI